MRVNTQAHDRRMISSKERSSEEKSTALAQRRQDIAKSIHDLWTQGGSDLSGLAPALVDGRLDALGRYSMLSDFHDDIEHEPNNSPGLPSRDTSMSYEEFKRDFMLPNLPVMITGLTEKWKARKWLRKENDTAVPDMSRLGKIFGSDSVPVHSQSQAGFTLSRPVKEDMTVSEYADWWELHHSQMDDVDPEAPLLYLKDWKLVASRPKIEAYEWPIYFLDDWLNGAMGNAYKFVYLGPEGTSTRLHADVLRSFSWSTNVCGRKRWYLIPPEYTYLLMDCFGRQLAPHLHADVELGVESLFPGLKYARRHALVVVQEAGETIFVPSKWHHTVENLAPTMSINHNWLNGANIRFSWGKLKAEINASDHSPRNDSAVASDSGGEQVGDDLLLLWLVLARKARQIFNANPAGGDEMAVFDLQAMLPILQDIQVIIADGKDLGFTDRCECDIDELILSIRDFLGGDVH